MTPITERDKMLGAAVNISAIFFPYAGPIVCALVCGKAPFVRYHAYRALIEQVIATVIIGFLMICSISYSVYSFYHQMEGGFDWSKIDWWGIILKSLVTWLLLGLWGVVNIFLALRDALEAYHGKLPLKPKWSERKALRLSGMDLQTLPQPTPQIS